MSGPRPSGLSALSGLGIGGSGIWSGASQQLPMPAPFPPPDVRPPRFLRPDPKVPDTMGWRVWIIGAHSALCSPHMGTMWMGPELAAEAWDSDGALRGTSGIHARLVPRHWKILGWPDDGASGGLEVAYPEIVTGIVERFGRYVLGTDGWRAEQVVIRELMAPTTEIGLKLEQRYPGVIVHYPDQQEEGEVPCASEKSSGLERGSRSLLPSSAPSPPVPQNTLTPAPMMAAAKGAMIVATSPAILTHQRSPNFTLTSSPPETDILKRAWGWTIVLSCLVTILLGFLVGTGGH